jgi:hypothetical protein
MSPEDLKKKGYHGITSSMDRTSYTDNVNYNFKWLYVTYRLELLMLIKELFNVLEIKDYQESRLEIP